MYIAVINLVVSIITACIFLGIFFITKEYSKSTKEIAYKTSESVEATKEYIKVISDIEKEKLTYELIKEWSYDKKLLTLKRQKLEFESNKDISGIEDYEKDIEFIEYLSNFFDYFKVVNGLIENNKIDKELYLKVLSRELVNFCKDEYKDNIRELNRIRDTFNKKGKDLPIISTFDELRKVVYLAEDEITPGTHTNYF